MSSADTSNGAKQAPQRVEKVSWWEKASTLATFAQIAVLIFSVVLIRRQLKQQTAQVQQQTNLAQAVNIQNLAASSSALSLQTAQSDKLARLWIKHSKDMKKGDTITDDDVEEEQFRQLIVYQMVFYENMFYQCEKGLLDDSMYKAWDADLIDFIRDYPDVKAYWEEQKALYHEEFRNHVQPLIDDPQKASPQPCVRR
jgi:hypothetical protein